ncbi:hypothetical protein [Streptomyces aidingensis]|uniref:hypothetical protein n=1 Tax=Streptomyces aidingensis TaxID=910347 RepID=UPI000B83893A|nr:hypothetical protein [Streptomyces aidingensis]
MSPLRRAIVILAGATGALLLPAGPAQADPGDRFTGNDEGVYGESDGQDIGAGAQGPSLPGGIVIEGGSGEGGTLRASGGNWEPPPCYYAPEFTPGEFEQYHQDYLNTPLHSGKAEAVRMFEEQYVDGEGVYENYNLAGEGEGMWWGSFINENSDDYEAMLSCNEPRFWVEFGDAPPPVPGVVTPGVLAELAYEHTRVPDTETALNPDENEDQVVGLATWIWTEGAATAPVSVTARVEGYDIWATTTATPSGLTIGPGTENAILHPSDGECAVSADGRAGEPYAPGRAGETPPCGVTYLRATHGRDPYQLSATLNWSIAWTGSGGTGGDLPDGSVEGNEEVTVAEIQAIVR